MIAQVKTLEKYCKNYTMIENYGKALQDRTTKWIVHHRLEIDKNMSRKELKEKGLYYDRPPEELIFVTPKEHCKLHFTKPQTELHKQRISEALKDRALSCSTKYKMSKSKVQNHLWVKYNFIHEPLYIIMAPYNLKSIGFIEAKLGTDEFFEAFMLLKRKNHWYSPTIDFEILDGIMRAMEPIIEDFSLKFPEFQYSFDY